MKHVTYLKGCRKNKQAKKKTVNRGYGDAYSESDRTKRRYTSFEAFCMPSLIVSFVSGGFKPTTKPSPAADASPSANLLKYRGPTHYCNWFMMNVSLAGAYPGSMDDRIHRNQLSLILKAGITTFVCTQAEYDPNATESEWRRCLKLRYS